MCDTATRPPAIPSVSSASATRATGLNAHAYPLREWPAGLFARLPDAAGLAGLAEAAACTYGVPSPDHVVCAGGTQILLPLVAALVPPGRAAVLGPTYAEHARA